VGLDPRGLDLRVSDSSARAIQNGTRNSSIVRLRSSRYSGDYKKKTKGNTPQQGHIESHIPPQKAPTTEQSFYFAGDRISNSCSPSKRTIEIRTVRHITGKDADEPLMESVSETGCLLLPLSIPFEVCQVFLFSESCFSLLVVCIAKS
jgi:hypothetical protein